MFEPFLLPETAVESLDDWISRGGGEGLERAFAIGPTDTIAEVVASGVRGRGGAGFPAGRKWQSVADTPEEAGERHVVINAAEGEPATFKDRTLIRANPYQMLEGAAIAAYAVGAVSIHVGIRARCQPEIVRVEQAVLEMTEAGWFEEGFVRIVPGPEHYLFGEEKGLLQAIEGDDPLPRWLPPYLHGLFASGPQLGWSATPTDAQREVPHANPTIVNNSETFSACAHVLRHGSDWFRSIGTPASPGSVICTVVGDTVRAGVGEFEMGTPLAQVIDELGGGVGSDRSVKAVLSGVANPILTADALDAPVSYEGLEAAGGGLGAAGFLVYDDTTSIVEVAAVASRFLYVESCGQCNACKLGTGAITDLLEAVLDGRAGDGVFDELGRQLGRVTDGNRCYLPVQEREVVASALRRFPEDFAAAVEGLAVHRRGLPIPVLDDIVDGQPVWDEEVQRKQPDWTYVDTP